MGLLDVRAVKYLYYEPAIKGKRKFLNQMALATIAAEYNERTALDNR